MPDLERYYELIGWPMRPDEEEARRRFVYLRGLFGSLIDEGLVKGGRILDVMAGSCIAGAALASELRGRGMGAELLCVDVRERDLGLVNEWLRLGGAEGVPAETVVCDARRLSNCLDGKFRTTLIWGSSLPHLSPWDLILAVSGIWELSEGDATLLIQQRDFMTEVFLRNDYRHFIMESDKILSVHRGYDLEGGMVIKSVFEIPGMRPLGELKVRLWDVASVVAIARIFFKDVLVRDLGRAHLALVAARGKREKISHSSLSEGSNVY